MLFLGDSNTYGVFVDAAQAYPIRFQALWNALPEVRPIEVLNLGYPGMNSSRLRNMLPSLLRTMRPDVVLIMVGVNDFWTIPEPIRDIGERATVGDFLWRISRVYRLLILLQRSWHVPQLEVPRVPVDAIPMAGYEATARFGDETFRLGYQPMPTGVRGFQGPLRENLVALVASVRDSGVQPVLLTYPSGNPLYQFIDDVIREAAGESGATFVDLTPVFAARCPEWRCEELLPDQHPSAPGHELAAETLVNDLRDRL